MALTGPNTARLALIERQCGVSAGCAATSSACRQCRRRATRRARADRAPAHRPRGQGATRRRGRRHRARAARPSRRRARRGDASDQRQRRRWAPDHAARHGAEAIRRRRSRRTTSCSASARPAPERRTWPWPSRSPRSSRNASSASSWRARGRGRRKARLLARRHGRKVDPYLRPLYDALHDMLPANACSTDRARQDRGRAARVHARPYAQRQLHHPRRSPEHPVRRCACF